MDLVSDSAFNPSSPLPSRVSTPTPASTSKVRKGLDPQSSGLKPPSTRTRPEDDNAVDLGSDGEEGSMGQAVTADGEADGLLGNAPAALEKQAGEVVQQLSSWGNSIWGGFRKQSTQAYEAVKKDISRTVKEAQDDLERIQKQSVEVVVKDQKGPAEAAVDKGKGKATEADELATEDKPGTGSGGISLPSSASDFFAQLQSTVSNVHLPTNIHLPSNLNLSSAQKTLSDTINSNPHLANLQDITALRTTLTENIQKNLANSGVTLKQAERIAEEYLKKSEILLNEAGDFLKDAVKIVPPTEGDTTGGGGVSWDGSDLYAFTTIPSVHMNSSSSTSLNASTSRSKSSETIRLSRKDALLRRLRSDRDLFLLDPSSPNETQNRRDAFGKFEREEVKEKGGIEGERWTKLTWEELGPDGNDVEALKTTRDELVPSQIPNDLFWTRYFFHKHMIEQEEDRRQMLLKATQTAAKDEEDDFSWDADEEEPRSPLAKEETEAGQQEKGTTPSNDSVSTAAADTGASTTPDTTTEATPSVPVTGPPTSHGKSATTSTNTSPRASEESYDVVSDQSAVAEGIKGGKGVVGGMTPAIEKVSKKEKEKEKEGSDESDDDWE